MTSAEARVPFFLVGRFVARSSPWTLVLTIVLLSIAYINVIFVTALFNGIVEGSDEQIINAYVGHVTISPPPERRIIEDVDQQISKIRGTPGVTGASAQNDVFATLQFGNIVVARPVLAIDPDNERSVTNIAAKIVSGTYLRGDDGDGIILGIQLAGGPNVEENATSLRGAKVGDVIRLAIGNATKDFTVRGIFRTKLLNTDLRAFITQRGYEAINPLSHNRASMIIVRATKRGDEQRTIDALRRNGVIGSMGTWQDSADIMKFVTKSFSSINVLISFVGLLIAFVTTFIVIYIDITNHKRQIGILRAIGVRSWIVRATYVLQSFIYAASGVLVGLAVFFAAIVPFFRAHPFSLPLCDAVLAVDPRDLAYRALAVIVVAIVSGVIPAALVTRMRILDTILGT